MEDMGAEVDRKIETGWLLAFYGPLLTIRQQEILRLSCEEDLSLGEIAQQEGVSRQGIYDILHRATEQLYQLEEKLGMYRRFREMQTGLENALQTLSKIEVSQNTQSYLDDARKQIAGLLQVDEEEEHGL